MEFEFYEKGRDILLILTGIGGSTKGYQNKYETIAMEAMGKYNFSVAVAATPNEVFYSLKEHMLQVMDALFERVKNKNCKIYAMGTSAGANIVLSFSYLFPQIVKVLAINPVMNFNYHLIENGIKEFTGEKINVFFGENDSSCKWATLLPKSKILDTTILPNIDHEFRGNLQEFIELPIKYLFD